MLLTHFSAISLFIWGQQPSAVDCWRGEDNGSCCLWAWVNPSAIDRKPQGALELNFTKLTMAWKKIYTKIQRHTLTSYPKHIRKADWIFFFCLNSWYHVKWRWTTVLSGYTHYPEFHCNPISRPSLLRDRRTYKEAVLSNRYHTVQRRGRKLRCMDKWI